MKDVSWTSQPMDTWEGEAEKCCAVLESSFRQGSQQWVASLNAEEGFAFGNVPGRLPVISQLDLMDLLTWFPMGHVLIPLLTIDNSFSHLLFPMLNPM